MNCDLRHSPKTKRFPVTGFAAGFRSIQCPDEKAADSGLDSGPDDAVPCSSTSINEVITMKQFLSTHIRTGLAVAAGVVVLGSLAASPVVLAISDLGNYPGGVCVAENGSADIKYDAFAVAFNSSTGSARTVTCAGRTDTSKSNVRGFVTLRKHTTATVSCSINYDHYDNSPFFFSNVNFTGTGVQTRAMPVIGNISDGKAYYRCSLPAASGGSTTGVVSVEFDQ
ncbi:MAG: hypothetical protein ACT4QA_18850 [Panacagrimonas sp.]